MCHDGAAVKPQSSTTLLNHDADDGAFNTGATTIIMRSMIHWFVCQRYNVSLLNTLEFRDTKVR
jgi:hypothetical protein